MTTTTMTASGQPAEPALPLPGEDVEESAPPPVPPVAAPIADIADGVEHPLDPRALTLDRLVGWLVTAAVSLGALVPLTPIFLRAPLPDWGKAVLVLAWTAVTLVLAWSAHRLPVLQHHHASYKVDDNGIEIRRGVVWRKVINVPRSRVQHTDVSQGPLERRFGLGTLVLYTAGTDHARVDLHGLDHGTALRIRDHLVHGDGDAV